MSHTQARHNAASHADQQRKKDASDVALQAKRKSAIKALKTKVRQLGMDDATYRAMLQARVGKTSATQCSLTELCGLNEYLSAQGARNPKALSRPGKSVAPSRQALMGKVQAQMGELGRLIAISDPRAYVNAILAKNEWGSELAFADVHILHKLVGALSRTITSKTRAANQAA
jgi:phage gp16-like protein